MKPDCRKPRILIVDDDSMMRHLIRSFYDECGFELNEAANGQEAVTLARSWKPDLILLDIQMPIMNGYKAAAILKNDEDLQNIPILVITGQDPVEPAERIDGLYEKCLRKPFYRAELIRATLQSLPG